MGGLFLLCWLGGGVIVGGVIAGLKMFDSIVYIETQLFTLTAI